jgi:transposase
MALLTLTETERSTLQHAVKHAREAHVVKRAQALLWLDQGETPATVAPRLQVSRQSIYNWVHAFRARSTPSPIDRLRDQKRSGRPPTKRAAITALIRRLWQPEAEATDEQADIPRNAPALQRRLKREGVVVHERTIRRTLRALDYRYKRPRYVLARRSKTWRQQKGG